MQRGGGGAELSELLLRGRQVCMVLYYIYVDGASTLRFLLVKCDVTPRHLFLSLQLWVADVHFEQFSASAAAPLAVCARTRGTLYLPCVPFALLLSVFSFFFCR